MSKAVMISMRPEWCEKILSGEKTIEVRKTRPKLETPFKVYIYCTKNLKKRQTLPYAGRREAEEAYACGKIVAEFTCDRIMSVDCDSVAPFDRETKKYIGKESCLDRAALWKYTNGFGAYGWHISDLEVYDRPKKITDFRKPCSNDLFCDSCAMHSYHPEACGNAALHLKRPPQSWCYVEEAEK